MEYIRNLGFARIKVDVTRIGDDVHIILQGGERPHIGCTVLSIPRPSLSGDHTCSSTSSVLNVTGHKDETLCRYLAEYVCKHKNQVVVCTGGFHVDHITKEQISMVMDEVKSIAEEIVKHEDR